MTRKEAKERRRKRDKISKRTMRLRFYEQGLNSRGTEPKSFHGFTRKIEADDAPVAMSETEKEWRKLRATVYCPDPFEE